MPPIEIRVDSTPNPEAMKFTVNRQLTAGPPLTVTDRMQALTMPVAGALLEIAGVKSLFFLRDFVTVTRTPGAEWSAIIPAVEAALTDHAG